MLNLDAEDEALVLVYAKSRGVLASAMKRIPLSTARLSDVLVVLHEENPKIDPEWLYSTTRTRLLALADFDIPTYEELRATYG